VIDLMYQVREVRGVEATAAADLPQKHCQLFGNLFSTLDAILAFCFLKINLRLFFAWFTF
jgi:hypothetical protein